MSQKLSIADSTQPIAAQLAGFTIVELIIATVIFSAILLICTTGIIQIGRFYYKGITSAKTQEVARSTIDDISRSIQFSNDDVRPLPNPASATYGGATYYSWCVGEIRYSFILNSQLKTNPNSTSGNPQTRHALWLDSLTSNLAACVPLDLSKPTPQDSNTDKNFKAARELLSENMRLQAFNIVQSATVSSLYNIQLRVAYGDKDLFDNTTGNCVSSQQGGQFCATSELNTSVTKRIN